jgi:hypothetical protein
MPIVIVFLLLALGACAQSSIAVDTDTLERCQMRDLQGKQTYVFRRRGCVADVRFGDQGEVLSFEPVEGTEATCREILKECGS